MDAETILEMADWRSSSAFDENDRLVLEFTEVLTQENVVSDALYARLAAAFTDAQLARLTMTIGLAGLVNRVHATFHTDVDAVTRARLSGAR